MAKEIILIVDGEDCEVYAKEGYAAGDPAVKIEWGFATGSSTGIHNAIDAFAIAEAGRIGKDGDFEPDKYAEAEARCTGCGLRWITSAKTIIPKSGYICPHCESRLRAGEPLKHRKEGKLDDNCYRTAF